MFKGFLSLCLLLVVSTPPVFGDEQIREVQEELRKRNLYFGDVDGKTSPDLANALKRYQARKGFPVTGAVDETTATSLNVTAATMSAKEATWPEMPVLKSDSAREIAEAQRQRLAKEAEENLDAAPTPAPVPPAEAPPPSQNLTPDRVTKLVEQYLHDAQTTDVAAQTRYFAYPVEYFVHGEQGPAFVRQDVERYIKRWPERNYMLTAPVTFTAGQRDDETIVQFPIAFSVRNKNHVAKGRTNNIWTVRPEGEELKIVAIREERLRD